MKKCLLSLGALLLFVGTAHAGEWTPPGAFRSLFNGKDFSGWHGKPHFDVVKLNAMPEEERKAKLAEWQADVPLHWEVRDGVIYNDGKGVYLTTNEKFRDYELILDFKTYPKGDSGVYLKNNPQVQIWDFTEEGGAWKHGSDKGSGGLWNNSKGAPGKDPLVLADRPFGEWNNLRVRQIGSRTSVWLNDVLVVNHAIMENYFYRKLPIPVDGEIQLQTHGSDVYWRNIAVREIPTAEANEILRQHSGDGFVSIFNGKDFTGWAGAKESYEVFEGSIRGKVGKGDVLFTEKVYADFVVRLDFKLPPAGNNGLAIRYPGKGGAAFDGMTEVQILDSEHEKYAKIDPRQAHGSVYGMIPAARGFLRPTGEWNYQVTTVKGSQITVEVNGFQILDGDVSKVTEFMGDKPHPGMNLKQGHFGFAGHQDPVQFRNIDILELSVAEVKAEEKPAAK